MPVVEWSSPELTRLVAEFEQRGGNVERLAPVAAEILVTAIADVFEAEGPGWAPLKQSTLDKRRGSTGHRILQDSTLLVGTIVRSSSGAVAEAGTNVPYGGFHVTGTSRMARRDFLAIDWDAVTNEVADLLLAEAIG